jgi:hypothetical protein
MAGFRELATVSVYTHRFIDVAASVSHMPWVGQVTPVMQSFSGRFAVHMNQAAQCCFQISLYNVKYHTMRLLLFILELMLQFPAV